jgi:hypothetical protein
MKESIPYEVRFIHEDEDRALRPHHERMIQDAALVPLPGDTVVIPRHPEKGLDSDECDTCTVTRREFRFSPFGTAAIHVYVQTADPLPDV